MAAITTTTAANLLMQTWRPELATQCNEEMRVANDFDNGNDGVSKFGKQLNIRKVARIAASTIADAGAHTSLTYTGNTEDVVTATPTFAWAGIEVQRQVLSRAIDEPKLRAAWRKQIAAGLATKIDADAAALASGLSTNVKGGAAQNFDKTFLLDGIGALISSARDQYSPGAGKWAFLKYNPAQWDQIHAINEITNAQIRGDGEKPVKVGWVWEAYGLKLMETGSVVASGGIHHNLLHIKESHILAYNTRPEFLSPQEFELVVRIIAFTEYAVKEVWDEYAVDMQTAA